MGGKGKGGKSGKGEKAGASGKGKSDKGKSEKGKSAKGESAKGSSAKGGSGKGAKGKTKVIDGVQPASAKTVQEFEAELLKKGSKSRVDARGMHCQVRKHTDMGCAVVTMESEAARDIVLEHAASKTPAKEDKKDRPEVQVGEYSIQMRRHYDKTNQEYMKTDIFVAWGRQNERRSPLAASTIAETFDNLFRAANPAAAAQANAMQAAAAAAAAAVPSPCMPSVLGAGQTGAAMMPGFMPMHPQQYGMPMAAQWHAQMAQYASMMAAHAAQAHQAQQAAQQAQQHLLAQHQQQQQTESGAKPDPAKNDGEAYAGGCDASGYLTQERKALSIIDPKSGEPIKFDLHKVTANRPLSIIDPSSGCTVDTTDMKSTPAEAQKLETPDSETKDAATVETQGKS